MSAFAGVRIVDFTQGLAGPMAAMMLGDFEADIIKVEPPQGDRMRDHPGYLAWNRNKRLLTLDLATEAGIGAARDLIARADVALFDHHPGKLEALGLDARTITEAHPHLIHAWMPPYGTTGSWSQLPSHHSLLTALSGVAFRQGAYSDQPIHLILPLCHYGQAVMGAAAISAALLERHRSGKGQAVTVSGLHGVSEVTGPVRVLADPPLPRGAPLGASPSYRLYECGDGQWFFLATLFVAFYHRAIQALGLGDHWETFASDPLLAREALKAVFKTRPRAEWLELLQANGVPCAPVGPREPWFAGEAVAAAEARVTLDHPELGPVHMPNVPSRLSVTPGSVRHLAKPLNGHAWPDRPAPQPTGANDRPQPLSGIKVLDLGTVIAGAHAGGVLANLGADVIKIEPIEGDPFRSNGGGFMAYSRGKRGLGIDLKQPAAREMFFDLVRGADVILDNYRFGVRERLGIHYAALKAVNPRIVSCSINAYGDKGARAVLPGFDPLLQAEGGMMAAQGGEGEPVLHTIPVNDVATAAVVAFSIIAALNARETTGKGQEVVTSLMAQSLTFQLGEVTTYEDRPPNDVGAQDCLGLRALHRYYPCADGWIALVCETREEADSVCGVLRIPLPANALTAPRDGHLARALELALATRMRDGVLADLLAQGVPCAPVLRGYEAFESEWLWENDFFEVWRHPRLGDMLGVRAYADFARGASGFQRPTPDLGQHSGELLEEMGYSHAHIAELLAAGAIFGPAANLAHLRDGGTALFTQ
ncbi:MAG: CoA transferase [Phenylobacterium sp.]|uniref:CaiB/BaiF CoA transferase family protein n=1 Tax=Phenylobacterium sp. TaxID=1871053 RepID=UPI00272445E9|nr:CoA transferase [Phenylobacterium sp.]MDO8913117.1 CoA transferase [Phenylobacterium sp.]MDP3101425.1 CoA transferase [Phenylobacterium sp.]